MLVGVADSNPAGGMGVCVACCKCRQKAKWRTIKTKEQVRMKYREYKKNPFKGLQIFSLL